MSLCDLLGIDEPVVEVEEEIKVVSLTPFNFVNSINFEKNDLFAENENAEKNYNAFIINRALSFSPDTVIFVNEMNRFPHIPKQMQYEFLKATIRKKKRFDKWIKAEAEADDISTIKEYYNYSNEKAKQVLDLFLPGQLDDIRQKMFKGGMAEKKTRQKKGKE